jgi:peptide/nickel transport system substrate-binding protein
MFIKLNDLVVDGVAVIPVVYRPTVHAVSNKLKAPLSGWDSTFYGLRSWYREA